MKRPMNIGVFVLAGVLLGCSSASAGWWDLLEALSGPGPFRGTKNFIVDIYCAGQDPPQSEVNAFDRKMPNFSKLGDGVLGRSNPAGDFSKVQKQGCVYYDEGHYRSETNLRFPLPVEATFHEVGVNFRVIAPIEVGAGAGWLTLETKNLNETTFNTERRGTITPIRLTFVPLYFIPALQTSKWPGVIKVYFRQTLLVGGLRGEDFGANPGVFQEETEFVRSFGVRIDVLKLFKY